MKENLFPENVRYSDQHLWIARVAPWRVGVTDYAQRSLGTLLYVEMPEPGERFAEGEAFGTVESAKSVSTLYMPVSGVIKAVNEALIDAPEWVNTSPYDRGWIVELEDVEQTETDGLLTAQGYRTRLVKP